MILATQFIDSSNRSVPVLTSAWSVQAFDPHRVLVSFVQNGTWRTEVVLLSMEEFARRVKAGKAVIDLRSETKG